MRTTLIAAAGAFLALVHTAQAADRYVLDSSHSQILFSYDHLGYSTTWGMFSGFDGALLLDKDDPANSSIRVTIPTESIITGWAQRTAHFLNADFFDAPSHPVITFLSTDVEPTGPETALITGELTLNGITRPVVLDARLNAMGSHPMANRDWAGFDATATLLRSDFDMGEFAPFVGDAVALQISIEAMKVEE